MRWWKWSVSSTSPMATPPYLVPPLRSHCDHHVAGLSCAIRPIRCLPDLLAHTRTPAAVRCAWLAVCTVCGRWLPVANQLSITVDGSPLPALSAPFGVALVPVRAFLYVFESPGMTSRRPSSQSNDLAGGRGYVPAFVELESGGPPPVACRVVGVGQLPSHPTKDGREQARDRLLGYYLATALLNGADAHLRALPGMAVPQMFTGRDGALAWLDGERASLVAAPAMGRRHRPRPRRAAPAAAPGRIPGLAAPVR